GLAGCACDRRGRVIYRRVAGQVAEVGRVPELEGLYGAVAHVLLERVGGAQTGERDLALVLGRVEDLRRGQDAHRGRRDDALEVGVGLQQPLGDLGRGGRVVVAVDGADQVRLREVLRLLLHE